MICYKITILILRISKTVLEKQRWILNKAATIVQEITGKNQDSRDELNLFLHIKLQYNRSIFYCLVKPLFLEPVHIEK